MKIKIPLQLIELEDENYHLILHSVFADGTAGYWVVDTGASKTVFDRGLEDKYKVLKEEADQIHTAGIGDKPIETTMACMKSFSLGKLPVNDFHVALLDLEHINQFYSKASNHRICGLLGGDFLLKYKAVIDYKKMKLSLTFRSSG